MNTVTWPTGLYRPRAVRSLNRPDVLAFGDRRSHTAAANPPNIPEELGKIPTVRGTVPSDKTLQAVCRAIVGLIPPDFVSGAPADGKGQRIAIEHIMHMTRSRPPYLTSGKVLTALNHLAEAEVIALEHATLLERLGRLINSWCAGKASEESMPQWQLDAPEGWDYTHIRLLVPNGLRLELNRFKSR